MSDYQKDGGERLKPSSGTYEEKLVYVLPERSASGSVHDEISLVELWAILWRKRRIIVALTLLFAAGSVAYALLAEEWYRAVAVLAPVETRPSLPLGGQLSGFAALAGVRVEGDNTEQAIATLKSRQLAGEFIEDWQLTQVFFPDDWDPESGKWRAENPIDGPDVRDAIEYFHEKVLRLNYDRQTGLLTLAIEWKDPEVAAAWAAEFIVRANEKLRDRALREAERNVAYLEAQLSKTNVLTLQQSIGRLLESELQTLMLARGKEGFAFTVIDPAATPRKHIRPKRALVVVAGTIVGLISSVLFVFVSRAFSKTDS